MAKEGGEKMNISDKEKIELLVKELKSTIKCVEDYYENPEGADVPVDDILDSIVEDSRLLLQRLDLD